MQNDGRIQLEKEQTMSTQEADRTTVSEKWRDTF